MFDVSDYLGQLFIIGFASETVSDRALDFIAREHIGGVILFEHNCHTHEKARENIRAIRSASSSVAPFIAIDQEGGRICRLRGSPAEYDAPWNYGVSGEASKFREDYGRAAVYLESMGINLNLAPVCDLFDNPLNSCLAGRCFGDSPADVEPFIRASVWESRQAGLLCCLKHFPGLGPASADPHFELPVADYDELAWEQREMLPFKAGVNEGADIIMTTHLEVPRLDSVVVTESSKIIDRLIRKALGFYGPVITDDLTMAGADRLGDIGSRTIAAFNAGHDLLLFGKSFEHSAAAYYHFKRAFEDGDIDPKRVRTALDRVLGLKFKLDTSPVA